MKQALNLSPATLWVNHGVAEHDIRTFLQDHSVIESPLYYLEPALQLNIDNSAGRLKGFNALTRKLDDTGENYLLDAAYVFGWYQQQRIGLQVMATEQGCRWFQFSEKKRKNTHPQSIQQRSYKALGRSDLQRFLGNNYHQESSELMKTKQWIVTEYWHESGLLSWWISNGEAPVNKAKKSRGIFRFFTRKNSKGGK